MMKSFISVLGLAVMLSQALHGDALPQNVTNSTSLTSASRCEQLIINNNIETGQQGPRGDTGADGPPGVAGPPGPAGPSGGGVSYTRWGRTTCPTTEGTQLVYEGATVGSQYPQGGTAEFLCLHNEPQFLQTTPGQQHQRGKLYGTEYEAYASPPAFTNIFRHEAPCSICYTPTRSTKITIPGRIACPDSWTREYHGYLMGGMHHSSHRSRMPICVDVNAESITGNAGQSTTSYLYFIETTCTGIRCPPYSDGAEIACVVCTK